MPESLDVIPVITRQEHRIIEERIMPRLSNIYAHLEVPPSEIETIVRETITKSSADRQIVDVEKDLRHYLEEQKVFRYFDQKMDVRALMWYQKIAPYLRGQTFLDLGGGDGRTAKRVYDESRNNNCPVDITVTDILDYNDRVRGLPYVQMNGTKTKFCNQQFDVVFLGTVYHHVGSKIDDSLALIDESVRVTGDRLIVIESIYQDEPERLYTMWIDWFYNRVLHYAEDKTKKVNVPFNFRKPDDWELQIASRGLEVTNSIDLGAFQILNPEHHWLYVAERKS